MSMSRRGGQPRDLSAERFADGLGLTAPEAHRARLTVASRVGLAPEEGGLTHAEAHLVLETLGLVPTTSDPQEY